MFHWSIPVAWSHVDTLRSWNRSSRNQLVRRRRLWSLVFERWFALNSLSFSNREDEKAEWTDRNLECIERYQLECIQMHIGISVRNILSSFRWEYDGIDSTIDNLRPNSVLLDSRSDEHRWILFRTIFLTIVDLPTKARFTRIGQTSRKTIESVPRLTDASLIETNGWTGESRRAMSRCPASIIEVVDARERKTRNYPEEVEEDEEGEPHHCLSIENEDQREIIVFFFSLSLSLRMIEKKVWSLKFKFIFMSVLFSGA